MSNLYLFLCSNEKIALGENTVNDLKKSAKKPALCTECGEKEMLFH